MISNIITYSLYAVLLMGLIIVFYNAFVNFYAGLNLKRRLRMKAKENNSMLSKILRKASSLVYLTTGMENKGNILLILTVIIFFVIFLSALPYYVFVISMIISLFGASVPSLLLFLRLRGVRNRGSKEAMAFLNELYRQYRIESENIYTAMEKTSEKSHDYPNCARQLYLLLLRIRSSGSKDIIRTDCNDFAYAIGSTWAKSLSRSIYSATEGSDISEALLDLINQIKESSVLMEERKRLNSEAGRMTNFLVPVLYFATVLMSINYLGLSLRQFLHNQFANSVGLLLFMFIAALYFINAFILSYVNSDTVDI